MPKEPKENIIVSGRHENIILATLTIEIIILVIILDVLDSSLRLQWRLIIQIWREDNVMLT